jgi:ACS family hexuronate transporter-like MFS transporter
MLRIPLRWLAMGIFIISTTLNYLDRQLLSALAPTIIGEFHLTNLQYGEIHSVFSFGYALMAPLAGLFIDRVGLNIGASVSVALWSVASAATGLTHSFGALLTCRTGLGLAEAAGIPGAGKANGMYLESRELALGTAFNQVGITIGMSAAPLIVAALAPVYGWRSTFVLCGLLGFLWVPIWWLTSKRIPPRSVPGAARPARIGELMRDPRLWAAMFATVFIMALYTLWANWITLYFVNEWHLTQSDANRRFAWIPPIFATLGGFFGGWLAFHWIRRGLGPAAARIRVCSVSAVVLLATAAIPLMPNPALATAAISLSYFWALSSSANLYALPIDLFGPGRAAFGIAALTFAYGLMQAFLSPAIGAIVDHVGFPAVCVSFSVLPLVGALILRFSIK